MLIYVDIIVTSSSDKANDALITDLKQEFALKDLGPLNYFLGIEVKQVQQGILLTQKKYASEVIKKTGMATCIPVATPLSISEKYSKNDGDPLDAQQATWYRGIVGALQYLMLTRPDISFSVNKVCQFLNKPTTVHMSAVKRILWYIRGTIGMGIEFVRSKSHC
jgi:hypothetical protein